MLAVLRVLKSRTDGVVVRDDDVDAWEVVKFHK